MCVFCERKSHRLGIPKGTRGKITYWAHRFALPGLLGAIPFWNDRRLNVAIEAEFSRILRRRTHRARSYRGGPRDATA